MDIKSDAVKQTRVMLKDLLRALKPTVDMPGEMLTSDTVLDAVSGALDNVATQLRMVKRAIREAKN